MIIILNIIWGNNVFKENILELRFGSWKSWIIWPLVIAVIENIIYALTYFLSPAVFLSQQDIVEGIKQTVFDTGSLPASLVCIFVMNIFIPPILNLPLLVGGELGWRGFLMPRLLKIFPTPKAFLMGGAIWGVWHLFEILLGYRYPNESILGILLMILFCIPAGVILQYVYLKSGSIFVVALCHGSLNSTTTAFMDFLMNEEKIDPIIHGSTGIIGIIIWWIFGAVFCARLKKEYG